MESSNITMTKRYMDIKGKYAGAIYDFHMNEEHRTIISKWCLSCFDLAIETGRYKNIPRENRLCTICHVVGDGYHAIFVCHLYRSISYHFVIFTGV